ncbi:fibrocystin [Pelodytes ibericus]
MCIGCITEISGWILTEQLESYDFNSSFIDGSVIMMSEQDGVYTVCSLVDKETQTIYPIEVKHGYGKLRCKVEGNYIGSQNISFSVFNKGKSAMSKESWRISAKQDLFLFQTHAEIQSVRPDAGSIGGGTDITIRGNFFQQPAQVRVAGNPCRIKHISPRVIVCTTGVQGGTQSAPHPGNRGLLYEIWDRPSDPNVTDQSTGYRSLLVNSASSPSDIFLGLKHDFSARLSGFFVVPDTNNYTFWIQADGEAYLYFSHSEDAENKVRIASNSDGIPSGSEQWGLNWPEPWQQKSSKMELLQGQKYYIEMLQRSKGHKSAMKIGVQIHNTWLNPDIVNTYRRERHQIMACSSRLPDMQMLTLSGEGFMSLCWGNASSYPIPANASADQMQESLEDMLSVHCVPEVYTADVFLHNGFEEGMNDTGTGGERGSSTEPHCGRFSIFRPQYLLKASQSERVSYELNKYSHLCFAYKGYMDNSLVISFSYNNTFLKTVRKNYTCQWEYNTNQPGRWKFGCSNLWNCIKRSNSLNDFHTRSVVLVDQIALLLGEGIKNWFYVDDIIVANKSVEVLPADVKSTQPGGHIVESIFVTGSYPTYKLTSMVGDCGFSLPLIELCDIYTNSKSIEDTHVIQALRSGSERVELHTVRLQSASPPIGGTFAIHLGKVVITGVSVNISPMHLREILIRNTDIFTAPYINASDFTITKELNTCFCSSWTLSWSSRVGDLPNLFTVYDENLTGVAPSVISRVVYDGGVFIWPIFGDMLATANTLPQVTVHVNEIPATCSGDCAYQHLAELTPQVTEIQYSRGDECSIMVTISGSGYSENPSDLDIQINGTSCTAVYANRSAIECCMNTILPLGEHHVLVLINPKGFAVNATGQYISLYMEPRLSLVIPANISQIGGQLVVLHGIGFDELTLVYLGDEECKVTSSNTTMIECIAPPQQSDAGYDINITLVIAERWVTLPGYIGYDPSLNPVILSMSPNKFSVAGDQELFINMSACDNKTNMDIKVMVGNTTTSLKNLTLGGIGVNLPQLPPGAYNVSVTINGRAIGARGFEPVLQYVLRTFRVEPCCGSFLGGTIIRIYGKGFSTNTSLVSVTVEARPCLVLMSTKESITCRTPSSPVLDPELEDFPAPVEISISNYTAKYVNTGLSNASHLLFTYRNDLTPVVANLSWSLENETLQIRLSGFNLTNASILFENAHPSLNFQHNLTNLQNSRFGISLNGIEPGRYEILIYKEKVGYANITSQDREFELVPLVYSISLAHGLVCGGTLLTISGAFFKSSNNSVGVSLSNDYICDVLSFNHTVIKCIIQNNGTWTSTSPVYLNVSVIVNGLSSICTTGCVIPMSTEMNPEVNRLVLILDGNVSLFRFFGHRLLNASEKLNVLVDNRMPCNIMFINETMSECQIYGIPAGNHTVNILLIANGEACSPFFSWNFPITSNIMNLSGLYFGINGGGLLTIEGSALQGQNTTVVYIGTECCVTITVDYAMITCIVPPGRGTLSVTLRVDNLNYTVGSIHCLEEYTPTLHLLKKGNNTLTLLVSGITAVENTLIFVGDTICANVSGNSSALQCSIPPLPAGRYKVKCLDREWGWASSNITFTSPLKVTALKNNIDCGENRALHISGEGFFPGKTSVTICGSTCLILANVTTTTDIYCSNLELNSTLTFLCDLRYDGSRECYNNTNVFIQCDVTLKSDTILFTLLAAYVYACNGRTCVTQSMSSEEDSMGTVEITGLFISPKVEKDEALIYNCSCTISMATEAEMECEAYNQPITTKITEIRKNWAQNTQDKPLFHFCSLWSKNSSWPSGFPPLDGDNVTVERGRTLFLDTDTSLLNLLHVKGGRVLILDSGPVHLQAHYILVTHGGVLQAGTMAKPFIGQAQISLHGSAHSAPFHPFGVKFLAVRNGTLLLHGWVPKVTVTYLAREAYSQSTGLTLEEPVDWRVGDEVLICGSGFGANRIQEEIFTIEKINHTYISIHPPLRNSYAVLEQVVNGQRVYLRPVVAQLSRNIVIRGNQTNEYVDRYRRCLEAGVPDISKCLYERSEKKLGSVDLGSVLIMQALQNERSLLQISGVQFVNMGQAFRKHLSALNIAGNARISGSYIRGCTVLNSAARGLSISGVSGIKVEENIFYNIRGHGLLLEKDITIRRNLLIRVLGTDTLSSIEMVVPAAVYIRSPSNTIENNIVWNAGYGYMYHLSNDGPSQASLQSFSKNTAVSCLRFGFWLYPGYDPSNTAVFGSFSAWMSGGGAKVEKCRNIVLKQFNFYSCKDFGINLLESTGNAEISQSVLVGHLDGKETGCMRAGIKTPKRFQASLSNITFVNFDLMTCSAIETCSECSRGQGGFTVKTQQLKFLNSPIQSSFPFPHSAIIKDLDGSFSELHGGQLLASTSILPDSCSERANLSGAVPGSVCGEEVLFHRMSLGLVDVPDFSYDMVVINSLNKSTTLNYVDDTLSNQSGWLALLVDRETYLIEWDSPQMDNTLQYSATFDHFRIGNYILIEHRGLPRSVNITIDCGSQTGRPLLSRPTPGKSGACDWFFDRNTGSLTYLVPSALPHPIFKWSLPESWEGVGDGWGGNGSSVPQAGDDVIILPNRTIVVDTALPPLRGLYVLGILEFPPHLSNFLNVTCILIAGGELRIGTPQDPLKREQRLKILLRTSKDIRCDRLEGLNISSGEIGVYGKLQIHGAHPGRSWTHLGADVAPGNEMIVLMDSVDWKAGDHMVISASSYEPHQAECVQLREIYGHAVKIWGNLIYRHTGAVHSIKDTWKIPLSAEVGLLSRNVQITADVPCAGRMIVGEYKNGNGTEYLGYLGLSNVEISYLGSSLFSTITFTKTSLPSSITSSSIHHSCGGGIRAVNSTHISLDANVIFNSLGDGIHLAGQNHHLTGNLLTLIRQPERQSEWVTGIKMNLVDTFVLSGNAVAGSERIGFHVKGQKCIPEKTVSSGNVAHSSLHGVHFYWGDGLQNCTKIAGFLSYKNYDYGLIFHLEGNVIIENICLLDNFVGMLPVVSQVSSSSIRKSISIRDSLIVATSTAYDCIMDKIKPVSADVTTRDRAPRSPLRGRIGIIWPIFTTKPHNWPVYPWQMLATDGATSGLMKLQDVTFSGCTRSCYSDDVDVCIMSNPHSIGIMSPITAERTTMVPMKYQNMFYYRPAQRDAECPLSMECYGAQKALFKDLDGTSLGLSPPVTVFPKSDLHTLQPCLNLGIYKRENVCSYKSEIQGHICQQIDHAVVVLENIADSPERVSPVISVTNNFVDVFVNGNISQERCCSVNVHSTFYSILPANKITKVCFSGPTPKAMRLQLVGGQNTTRLVLALFYDTPQTVSVRYRGRLTSSIFSGTQPDFFKEEQTSIFFSFKENLLYVLLQGDEPVEIWANLSIHLAFYVAYGTSLKIYDQLPSQLAIFLGLNQTQIKILDTLQGDIKALRVMTDNTVKRKIQCPSIHDAEDKKNKMRVKRDSRRNVKDDSFSNNQDKKLEVILVEISKPAMESSSIVSYDEFDLITKSIIGGLQTGQLETLLPMHIDSLMVMDPTQSSFKINTRNTSGSRNDVTVYVRPHTIYIQEQPLDGIVGKAFVVQPKVTFLDIKGGRVENLGSPSHPWQVSVHLKDSSSTALKGNTTVVIQDGWGNFSNLAISDSGSDWCLIFNVTSPPGVTFTAQSKELKVSLKSTEDKENIFMLVVLSSAASATALLLVLCCFFKRKKVKSKALVGELRSIFKKKTNCFGRP